MNKKVLLPLVVVLSLMFVPIIAAAKTMETYHYNAKIANGLWELTMDGNDIIVSIVAFERIRDWPNGKPIKVMRIRVTVVEDTTANRFVEDLAPNEFKWSFGGCRVSTEMTVMGETEVLTVEWDTVPPTKVNHFTGEDTDYTYKGRTAWRDATATLMWGDMELDGSERARVRHTTATFYGGHP